MKSCMLKKARLQGLPRAVRNSPQEHEQKGDRGCYRTQKDDTEVKLALFLCRISQGITTVPWNYDPT